MQSEYEYTCKLIHGRQGAALRVGRVVRAPGEDVGVGLCCTGRQPTTCFCTGRHLVTCFVQVINRRPVFLESQYRSSPGLNPGDLFLYRSSSDKRRPVFLESTHRSSAHDLSPLWRLQRRWGQGSVVGTARCASPAIPPPRTHTNAAVQWGLSCSPALRTVPPQIVPASPTHLTQPLRPQSAHGSLGSPCPSVGTSITAHSHSHA